MRQIIGLGETVLDIIFRDNQPQKAVPGGSAFNSLISIGRTGTPCTMATEIGNDRVGQIVKDFMAENGVDISYVFCHEGTQTHISLAFLNERNDAEYAFYKNHAAITMNSVMPDFHEGDIILFGSFFAINPSLREYVVSFLKRAKEAGAILYYDVNFRASHKHELPELIDNIKENMSLATVVRGSSEDFEIMFGSNDVDEIYNNHIRPLCPCFIYTNADKPVELRTPTISASYPAKKIKTVSTIGAGDNFNAGFCYAVYNKDLRSLVECSHDDWNALIASGQAFSSLACQTMDNYIDAKELL